MRRSVQPDLRHSLVAIAFTSFACATGSACAAASSDRIAAHAPTSAAPIDIGVPPPAGSDFSESFGIAAPEAMGIDPNVLADLSSWVADGDRPIFSVLISRHGKLVYELYTSHVQRDDAHYLMSVTKSVTATLVGIAIDGKLIPGEDARIGAMLPAALFPSDDDRARFDGVTLHQVLGMSALDAPVPPHQHTRDAAERQRAFLASSNRARFALAQRLLPQPGSSFLYTDITPYVAGAAVSYSAKTTLFEFAESHLFRPLAVKNAEWMHEDASGMDNPAYGLRLRPVDMQKFGVLYIQKGMWNGTRVLSESWVEQCETPWIKSKPELAQPNYGNYFWTQHYGPWTAHVANGWKGQRVIIVPSEGVVVTMTADLEQGEDAVVTSLMEKFVVPAVRAAPLPEDAPARARLSAAMRAAFEKDLIPRTAEPRMMPSAAPKERHHALRPL
jgi:CubicO group peptidase (beta-lactamase class C family)